MGAYVTPLLWLLSCFRDAYQTVQDRIAQLTQTNQGRTSQDRAKQAKAINPLCNQINLIQDFLIHVATNQQLLGHK